MNKIIAITLCSILTIIPNVIHGECETEVTGSVTGGGNAISSYGCVQWWHNGKWHESVSKPGKHGYMLNGKFIELTSAELEASNAKKKQLME